MRDGPSCSFMLAFEDGRIHIGSVHFVKQMVLKKVEIMFEEECNEDD